MRKVIAFAISFALILASAGVAYGAGYTDVKPGNWAYEAVNAISQRGIINGYPNGSFLPNNTVTYGEFIKMALIAGAGEDAGNAASGHWALNYYNKALELKYFTEYDIDKSQLGDKITRADMALIISSILGDVKIDNYDKIQEGIEDITYRTPHEYDITKAYACGILTGYSDKTFRPDKTLSRAESAAVIYRLADESKRMIPGAAEETATDSAIKAPIFKTSDFLDMSKLTEDKLESDVARITNNYMFYSDPKVWSIKLVVEFNGDLSSFDTTLPGLIYLVKDGAIVASGITFPMSDDDGNYLGFQRTAMRYDITKADYIMSIPVISSKEDEIIKVIQNPFKE